MRKRYIPLYMLSCLIGLTGCSKLDEKFNGTLTGEEAKQIFGDNGDVESLMNATYDAMYLPYIDQSRWWAAQEHTTDEAVGPTRGGDWDDNGVWRTLHTHQWDGSHGFLADCYRDLGRIVFSATEVLRFSPTPQQEAEARFIRAYAMFSILEGWDQVPYRENTGDPFEVPKVRKGTEALDYIISEVEAVRANLPDGPAYRANKDAAKAFLMKLYLNKGMIANRAAPTFAAEDMQKVIGFADELINSNKYSLQTNFFDNFAPTNNVKSKELIYTILNTPGVGKAANARTRYFSTLHYNNNPSGWNGFTTLSDFYDKFDAADQRLGGSYPTQTDVSGLKTGFLLGQQYNQNGEALKDRNGAPLAFTKDVSLIEVGNNLEVTGIRVIKYTVDYVSGDNTDNDYVLLRYADVLLMKAEALLRTGNSADALTLVNQVRTRAGVPTLASIDLNGLLDERGRELYWEGWRRNDLLRFGKYLDAWQLKSADADPKTLLFPIPYRSLAANPNLTQNPGY